MRLTRPVLVWTALAIAAAVPLAAATASPLLAWRDPVYIAAGFAGIIAMVLLLFQPLLAAGYLPGLSVARARHIHRWTGIALTVCVVLHVAGLWITSPPDVIDALLFKSPTPFSAWGVIAMWAIFATGLLASLRLRSRPQYRTWRIAHTLLAIVIVVGTIIHAILIEGAMEALSKTAICTLILTVTAKVVTDLRVWATRQARIEGRSQTPDNGDIQA